MWNGAYENAFGADGFRVVPSFQVGSLRVPFTRGLSPVEVGLRASVIDLLAPVSELAMRRSDLDYDWQGNLFLEFIKPRLEVALVAPGVARQLALVTGASMRMAAPFVGTVDPSAPKPANSATYLTPFSSAPARSERFASFVEVGVGLACTF